MATLSVLKFNDLNGADRVLLALQGLQERQMITLEDAAVVSWPLGSKKPTTRQLHSTAGSEGSLFRQRGEKPEVELALVWANLQRQSGRTRRRRNQAYPGRIKWWRMPLFTPQEREETAQRVSRLLVEDSRVEGVVVVGSLAGRADRWSDIDLEVLVADDEELPAVAADWVGHLYELLPVVHHFETAFGETLVRGFLLENLLELDLAFERAERFSIWGPARVVFDRSGRAADAANAPTKEYPHPVDRAGEAGFAWHDVLHACTAVRRDRPWQGLWYLERVRNRTLKLAQERLGFYAEFFDYVDDLPVEELTPLEDTLVVSLDPEPLLGAIEVATQAFLAELRHSEPALAERLEGPLLEFARLRELEAS